MRPSAIGSMPGVAAPTTAAVASSTPAEVETSGAAISRAATPMPSR
jgi:hypothetical protein